MMDRLEREFASDSLGRHERPLDTAIAVVRELIDLRRLKAALDATKPNGKNAAILADTVEQHRKREAQAWAAAEAVAQWRPELLKRYARMGDMAPPGCSHLTVLMDGDGDAGCSVWEQENEQHGQLASIEFCTFVGGGTSWRTREAMAQLARAIELDNLEDRRKQWPPEQPTP